MTPHQPWRNHAACRTHPRKNIWFSNTRGNSTDAIEAKQVCRDCLVRLQCLAHALEFEENYGIWGGKSAEERRDIKRRRHA